MPATASRPAVARRWATPASTEANQSDQRVRASSVTSVPCPARRTAWTGNPCAASVSASGRISSGVPVKPWTRRQPSGREPGRLKASTIRRDARVSP